MAAFARTGIDSIMALAFAFAAACQGPHKEPHDARSASSSSAEPTAPAPTASAPMPASDPRFYDRTTKSIDARQGDRFVVALPGNVTTGFQWRQEPPADKAILTSAAPTYASAPPAGCPACVGYGGTFLFELVAAGPGSTKVHFAYVQAGRDPPPPTEEVTIVVNVAAR